MTAPSHVPRPSQRERRQRERQHDVDSVLQTVFECSPDAVIVVNRSGFITSANAAFERIAGCPVSEVREKPIGALVRSPKDLTRMARILCGEDEVRDEEIEAVRARDDETLWLSVSARALRDGDYNSGAIVWIRDITEARAERMELERQNAELEHYVHAVSHDLRSPLVSLLGFSRLLDQDYGDRLDDKGRHFLHRIEQAARTMEALINDLLELSRIGQTGERRVRVDLLDVLRQLQAEFKPRLDARAIDLVMPTKPPLLYCDRTRVYQLFSNLIGNAVEHMGDCPEPRIEVTADWIGEQCHLEVRDNGCGIPPEHHERIFELFQSMGPRRDGRRGTGVGLAIVRKIAETQGGRVWVDSTPGAGSAFHVTLPAG